mmetsp:Transcript_15182/g.47176  ORF Transcript_15182/g.47176 Transcript_15182/m.47176 type:complete len:228 (+) Transcript_15182:1010-1693(+)
MADRVAGRARRVQPRRGALQAARAGSAQDAPQPRSQCGGRLCGQRQRVVAPQHQRLERSNHRRLFHRPGEYMGSRDGSGSSREPRAGPAPQWVHDSDLPRGLRGPADPHLLDREHHVLPVCRAEGSMCGRGQTCLQPHRRGPQRLHRPSWELAHAAERPALQVRPQVPAGRTRVVPRWCDMVGAAGRGVQHHRAVHRRRGDDLRAPRAPADGDGPGHGQAARAERAS